MHFFQTLFIEIGRIGIGAVFLVSVLMDLKTREQIFSLMRQKSVPAPWLFYIGAICWKLITSIGIIFNVYPFFSALLLCIYIVIANVIFNNFWAVPKPQRDFSIVMFLVHTAVCFGLLVVCGVSLN